MQYHTGPVSFPCIVLWFYNGLTLPLHTDQHLIAEAVLVLHTQVNQRPVLQEFNYLSKFNYSALMFSIHPAPVFNLVVICLQSTLSSSVCAVCLHLSLTPPNTSSVRQRALTVSQPYA